MTSTEKRKALQSEPMGATDAVMTTAAPAKRSKSESLTAPTDMTKAEPFPKDVPMENKYTGDKYFVRECYAEYYAVVMDLLRSYDGVSVTGTPGTPAFGHGITLCALIDRGRIRRHWHVALYGVFLSALQS
jgi:hypothetical protein